MFFEDRFVFSLLIFSYYFLFTQSVCPLESEVHIGSCVPYQGNPDICQTSLTNSSIWIPQGKTLTQLLFDHYEDLVPLLTYSNEIAKDPYTFSKSFDCLNTIAVWVCTRSYPYCYEDPISEVKFPQFQCSQICDIVQEKCHDIFLERPELENVLECNNCSSHSTIRQVFLLETNETYSAEVPCSSSFETKNCVYPLSKEGRKVFGNCGVVCPFPTWTNDEWDTIKGLTLGLSIVSCVATLIVIYTFITMPERRKFPNNLPLYLTISSFGLSFSYLLEGMIGFEDVWCDNESICHFQGWMVMFFMLSISTWWFSISLNVYLSSIKGITQIPDYELYYHIYAWGFPAFMSFLFVGNKWIIYNFGENTCDIIAPTSQTTPWERIWGYYVPIGAQLVVGTILILSIFRKMIQVSKDKVTLKKLLVSQLRIILFLLLFLMIQAFFFSYHLDRTLKNEDVLSSTLNWAICISVSEKGQSDTNCKAAESFNYSLFVLSIFASSGQGILFFLLFGTSVSTFRKIADKMTSKKNSVDSMVTNERDDIKNEVKSIN